MPVIHESYDIRTPNFSHIESPTFGLLDTAKTIVVFTRISG